METIVDSLFSIFGIIFNVVIFAIVVKVVLKVINGQNTPQSKDRNINDRNYKNRNQTSKHVKGASKKSISERMNETFATISEQVEKTKQESKPKQTSYRDYEKAEMPKAEDTSFDTFYNYEKPKPSKKIKKEKVVEPVIIDDFKPIQPTILQAEYPSLFDDIEPAEAAEMAVEAEPAKAYDEL